MPGEPSKFITPMEKLRFVCMEECYCDSGERSQRARLRNLSGSGAFVRTADPFPAGDRFRLRFPLAGKRIETTALVRHAELGYGMGVQFLEIRPGEREVLEKALSALRERLGPAAFARVRRAPRVQHSVAVRLQGKTLVGTRFSEQAETLDVSDTGARLLWPTRVEPAQSLTLKSTRNGGGSWAQFRIVWRGQAGTLVADQIGLEQTLIDFWGIHDLTRD